MYIIVFGYEDDIGSFYGPFETEEQAAEVLESPPDELKSKLNASYYNAWVEELDPPEKFLEHVMEWDE